MTKESKFFSHKNRTIQERPKVEVHKIPEVYVVVQEIGQELIQKMVNEWIDKGYVCIGGCDCKSISANPKAWIFTHALITESP